MKEQHTPPGRQPGAHKNYDLSNELDSTDLGAQRKRIYDFLSTAGPLTKLRARQDLNVMELRQSSYDIVTEYVLLTGSHHGAN